MAKKKFKKYVLEYRSNGTTRETVIWGPENLVDEILLVDDINSDTIYSGIVVHIREHGSFYRDYHEALRDMEHRVWIFTTFQDYLSKYYIPLSKGESPNVQDHDDPLEFIEVMKEQHNLVYQYIGHKVEYYIANEIELPVDVFIDFFYNDASNHTKSNYEHIAKKHKIKKSVERLEQKAKMLVSAIKELSEGLEEYKEEYDEYKE